MGRVLTPEQKAKAAERSRKYYREHKAEHQQRVLRWQKANPDKVREYARKQYLKDPEKAAEYQRRWQSRNRERVRKAERDKRRRDAQFRISTLVRVNTSNILNGTTKTGKWVALLGCSPEEFRGHLERQFTDGMTWATRGRRGWHLDHIKPLSSFDLTDDRQLREACHYTNVQPLWWRDNMQKGPGRPLVPS